MIRLKTSIRSVTDTDTAEETPDLRAWLTLGFLSLVWGTSYILIKKALGVYTPMQIGSLRLSISALAFLPYLLFQWRKIDWSRFKFLLLVGITGTGLPSFLFPMAQQHMSSSLAGILNSLTPIFTLLLGIVFFSARFRPLKAVGVVIGLMGAMMLFLSGEKAGMYGSIGYGFLVILACICYATSSNVVGHYLRDMNSIMISAVSFVLVGIPAMVYLSSSGFVGVMQTHPEAWTALGYVVILALGSTVLASVIFFRLIQWTNPVFGSSVSYLVPAIALLWGVLDGEPIGWPHFFGMSLILVGVYLSRK